MKDEILHHIRYSLGKDAEHSSVYDWRIALSLALRDRMVDHWYRSTRETYASNAKRVYYLSLEFLMGRLVEDEEQVSEVAARVLREAGYDVCVAADGAEAVRIARELDHVDLLFTDLVMPRMGGQEAADIIVRDHPDISLLFTTGYSERHLSHTGEPTLPGLFMEKPFTPRMLLESVRDALDGDGDSRTRTRTGVLGSFS